jgi:hypothetical protein
MVPIRSTTAGCIGRSGCIGHRAAPSGKVEARASGRTFRGATQSPLRAITKDVLGRCRHVAKRGATSHLSVSRSNLDIDRQVQLDETRLQQRHGQVIVQFNPGVGVAWRPPELLEDDLAGLPKG